jgi:hypothetical protein
LILSSTPSVPKLITHRGQRYWVCEASDGATEGVFYVALTVSEGLILLGCLIFSLKIRKIWATFGETMTLSLATFTTLAFIFGYLVLSVIMERNPVDLQYTNAYFAVLISLGVLAAHFLPRVLFVKTTERKVITLQQRLKLSSLRQEVQDPDAVGFAEAMTPYELPPLDVEAVTPTGPDATPVPLFALSSNPMPTLVEEDVEMKITDRLLSLSPYTWQTQRITVAETTHLFLPHYKPHLAHVLRRLTLVDQSAIEPNSFQLIASHAVYWIRCRDEKTYLNLGMFLAACCRHMDEDIEMNLH